MYFWMKIWVKNYCYIDSTKTGICSSCIITMDEKDIRKTEKIQRAVTKMVTWLRTSSHRAVCTTAVDPLVCIFVSRESYTVSEYNTLTWVLFINKHIYVIKCFPVNLRTFCFSLTSPWGQKMSTTSSQCIFFISLSLYWGQFISHIDGLFFICFVNKSIIVKMIRVHAFLSRQRSTAVTEWYYLTHHGQSPWLP